MNNLHLNLILLYGFFSLIIFFKGLHESHRKKSAFKLTPLLIWMGIFVWGDAFTLGFFWFMGAFISYLLKDTTLFWLLVSLFWLVRSLGESIYWFNQQFSSINRNPPQNLHGFKIFKNESIWFVYQTFWQCITVVAAVTSIYCATAWVKGFFP